MGMMGEREARIGFEPTHGGFANPCVNHFTTAPRQTRLRLKIEDMFVA